MEEYAQFLRLENTNSLECIFDVINNYCLKLSEDLQTSSSIIVVSLNAFYELFFTVEIPFD